MRETSRAVTAAAAAAIAIGLVPAIASAAPDCRPSLSPPDEVALTGLINARRSAEHAPKVVKQVDLLREGRRKSITMAGGGAFAHSGALSWANGRPGAQNIAMARSAPEAFQAMLASPAHRRNMLAKEYRLTGVGAAKDCTGRIFFTVNLMGTAPQ